MILVKRKTVIDIDNVPLEAAMTLYTIIQNSTRESMNEYLESRGGTHDIISEDVWSELTDIAKQIGPAKR